MQNGGDSNFKVNQTKGFIIFVNSKVAGEYQMKFKDFILFITSTI